MRFGRLVPFLMVAAIAASAAASPYRLGVVIESEPRYRQTDLDAQAINAVTTAFLNTRQFDVIERKELSAIFEEKSLKDIIGGEAGSLFETLGLDLIGFVSYTYEKAYTDPLATYVISVRLASVSTGEVLGTYDSVRPSLVTPSSLALAGDHLSANLREAFPPEGIVIKVMSKKEVVVDLGSAMGIKEGDTLRMIQETEPIIHPVTGEVLPGSEMEVGKLVVKNVALQTAVCKVKSVTVPIDFSIRVRYEGKLSPLKRMVPKSVQRLFQGQVKKDVANGGGV